MNQDTDPLRGKRDRIAAIGRRIAAIPQPAALHLAIPRLNLPKVEFPQLAAVGAELAAQSERWREAMAPLTAVSERFRRQIEVMHATFAPLTEQIRWLEEQERECERIEHAGWLPHNTSPFGLLGDGMDVEAMDRLIGDHYRANWDVISAGLLSGIEGCDLDDEAKQCFGEALAAHGAGFYRCAPRLLYPEVERVARAEIHGGALDRITNQPALIAAIGGLTPAEMSSTGVTGLRFYKKLTEHLYRFVMKPESLEEARMDPVPNRHAALHGLIPYTTAKNSLNSLLVADYLLQAISTIKRLAREDNPSEG